MGDIALPTMMSPIKSDSWSSDDYPMVAYTRLMAVTAVPSQSDAKDSVRMAAKLPASATSSAIKYNDTLLQKEIEILKQEVYHEGLQVEEEGLTDIMRRKTKLPNNNENDYSIDTMKVSLLHKNPYKNLNITLYAVLVYSSYTVITQVYTS